MLDHILIVDESRLVREALAKILLSCGISKTAIACIENVEDALDHARYSPVSLLICADDLVDNNGVNFRDELVKLVNINPFPLLVLAHQRNGIREENVAAICREIKPLGDSLLLLPPFTKQHVIAALFELTQAAVFNNDNKDANTSLTPPAIANAPNLSENKATILVVDDESINIDVVAGNLSKIYRVMAAKSGEDALRISANTQYNISLILLDIMMPQMDGYQVCKKLKENNFTANIPVIFLSARALVDDIKYGFDLGAVDYITKPLNGDLLRARVATHIRLQQQQLALAAQVATLEENAKLREDIEKITHHDLKAPLSNILFETHRLTDKTAASSINRAVNNIVSMINNSLNLYKIEQGIYTVIPEITNVNVLVHDAINAVANICREKNIIIDLAGFDTDHVIFAEPLLCLSIFNNLIKNAVEASPTNQTIVIKLANQDQQVNFQLTNHGVIPTNMRARLFEKYISSNYNTGLGLGTYSAKLMTQVQHGEISFEIIDELQTQFIVKLPSAPIN